MPKFTYKFQFNGGESDCFALAALLKDRWEFSKSTSEDGYTWFILIKWA